MTPLLACLLLWMPQQPTVALSQDATSLKVTWSSALPRLETSHWVGLVTTDRPDTFVDVPSTRYQYIPASASGVTTGEMTFLIPGPGEWQARYFGGNSGPVLARSPALVVGVVEPVDPVDPLPPVDAAQPKIIRARIVRSNGTVELFEPELNVSYANPAEAKASQLKGLLRPGDELFVDSWEISPQIPDRPADEVYRILVRRVLP